MYNDIRNFIYSLTFLNGTSSHEINIRAEIEGYLRNQLRSNELIWNDGEFINTVTNGEISCVPEGVQVPASPCGGLCYCGAIGNIAHQSVMTVMTGDNVRRITDAYGISFEYAAAVCRYTQNVRNHIVYFIEPLYDLVEAVAGGEHATIDVVHAVVDYCMEHERRHAEQHGAVVDDFIAALSDGTVVPLDEEYFEQYAAQSWEDDADRHAIEVVRTRYHI